MFSGVSGGAGIDSNESLPFPGRDLAGLVLPGFDLAGGPSGKLTLYVVLAMLRWSGTSLERS